MTMLTDMDRKVLEILNKKLLTTKTELAMALNKEDFDGTEINIQRLKEMGYVEKVESLGIVFVITQRGIRALREMETGPLQ